MYTVVNNVLFMDCLKKAGLSDEDVTKAFLAMLHSGVTTLNTKRLAKAGGTFDFYALNKCTIEELEKIPEEERTFKRNRYDWPRPGPTGYSF